MMKTTFHQGLASLSAGLALAGTAWGNLIENGGFEDPVASNSSFDIIGPGGTIWPWTVGGAGVVLVREYGHPGAIEGFQCVELNYILGGSVEQAIATTAGARYELSFWMAGQDNTGPDVKTLDVSWGDDAARTFTWSHSQTSGQWVQHSLELIASSEMTTLRFLGTVQVDGGAYIDDVQLTLVPSPGTALLMLGGVLAPFRRSRR